jgi:hypothetical protein
MSIGNLLTEPKYHFIWIATLTEFFKHGFLGNIWHVPSTNDFNVSLIESKKPETIDSRISYKPCYA